MMYAIIELGGRQVRVEPGVRVETNRVAEAVGATHAVERVLLAIDGTQVRVGRPFVPGGRVVCEVLEHVRGPKSFSFHYRRRENWRNLRGHRQPLSRLLVKEIVVDGAAAAAAPAAQPAARKPRARPAPPGSDTGAKTRGSKVSETGRKKHGA